MGCFLKRVAPVGLSPSSALDLPVLPILTSLHVPLVGCAKGGPGLFLFHCSASGPHGPLARGVWVDPPIRPLEEPLPPAAAGPWDVHLVTSPTGAQGNLQPALSRAHLSPPSGKRITSSPIAPTPSPDARRVWAIRPCPRTARATPGVVIAGDGVGAMDSAALGNRHDQTSVATPPPPPPRVQQTIKSSKKHRTGVFVGHTVRHPFHLVPKPGTPFNTSQKNTVRTEVFVGQGIRWTPGVPWLERRWYTLP